MVRVSLWGLRVFQVGGNSNNGANGGPFYWNANNAASNTNSYIGRRLDFIQFAFTILASWQKMKRPNTVLVGVTEGSTVR